jgi:predicted nucleic acid-binding protein
MSGNKILLDSNVIISISKNKIDIDRLLHDFDIFIVSIITYMEVLGYEFKNVSERKIIEDLFELIEIRETDILIAKEVIEYRKLRKIKLPDAIILGTAKLQKCGVLTDDWDDFLGIDSNVEIVKLEKYFK